MIAGLCIGLGLFLSACGVGSAISYGEGVLKHDYAAGAFIYSLFGWVLLICGGHML